MNRISVHVVPLLLAFLSGCGLHAEHGRQVWIISPSDGTVRTYCVPLGSSTDTGLDTLRATGEALELLEDPQLGTAVCKIGEVGWPSSACFGTGAEDPSWLYFRWNPGRSAWESAEVAVSSLPASDGEILAFLFTSYNASFNPVRRPPDVGFDEVCP